MENNVLESFNYEYNSFIFGNYELKYEVYKQQLNNITLYGIKLTNSINGGSAFIEELNSYDEAIDYVRRVDNLINDSEENLFMTIL